ncbi:hypothetical protein E9531_04155 [Lampropedia puyangensis]|uniref:Cell surface protein n=1 Tax=Lampropedia puyangensis TaxID=1330072 RepID=A0A4S8FFF3_9BURK|nr:hypothetical protein [Lampropedia puyangensis]THU04582.1 hypothetical protein E9531_04155 [Lampropedia puyangensis]
MKKNVFALSVAVALASLAGAANAQEVPFIPNTGGDAATKFVVNPGGVGHIQLLPYYSVQGNKNTLLNIVNTDTQNGKVVKVRFRGARNSDDVFDFYVFLSPGDVWRSRVYRDGGEQTFLQAVDNSCTWPNKALLESTPFQTTRVFNELESEVREGYAELLTAADIRPESDFYKAIKHDSKGQVACTETAIADALKPLTTEANAKTAGLDFPTTGLIAHWAITDVVNTSTVSANATTLLAVDGDGVAAEGNIVVAPQQDVDAPTTWRTTGTADPLLAKGAVAGISYFDFPDLSTPYVGGTITPAQQANVVSNALAVSELINEFTTGAGVNFKTDWVFSLPTRRYGVAIDYAANAGKGAAVYNTSSAFFDANNAQFTSVEGVPSVSIGLNATYWDNEEGSGINATVSPGGGRARITGEVNVFSFNSDPAESVLGAQISAFNVTPRVNGNVVESGWAKVALTNAAVTNAAQWPSTFTDAQINGLPVVGYAALTVPSNSMSFTWPHRFNRFTK